MTGPRQVPAIRGMGFIGVDEDQDLVDHDLEQIRAHYRRRLGLAGPSLPGLATSALSSLVRSVTFRANGVPPVTWRPGAPGEVQADTSGRSSASDLLQPAVDIEFANGHVETIAPSGEPSLDYRVVAGAVLGTGAVVVGTALLVGYALGRRRRA